MEDKEVFNSSYSKISATLHQHEQKAENVRKYMKEQYGKKAKCSSYKQNSGHEIIKE